ncbi:hypothetical protein N9277_01335, partial [bacterium]|nr:hypothetical protein [bacterium]
MSKLAKALTAAAGNAGESLYVEDVFSTYLYTGNNSTQTIDNGIDLDGEGGLVWFKRRSTSRTHVLIDTERGKTSYLQSNETVPAETGITNTITSFNSDGFSISDQQDINGNAETVASWTFRKAEKFFDVVTYTGNGVAGRTVAHNLGSTPACMIVKRTNASQGWAVYHVGMDATNPENWMMRLNATDARFDLTPSRWNDTAPTSTDFTLSDNDEVNGNGDTYVAYLFASDAGGFGDDGDESIIKCGSYTGNGTSSNYIDFGFEPQWFLVKNATSGSTPWLILDNMRGWPAAPASSQQELTANTSNAESTGSNVGITSTGIGITTSATPINKSGDNYIYIAIRRPMKTPESGTEVFSPVAYTGNGSADRRIDTDIVSDMVFWKSRSNGTDWKSASMLAGSSRALTPNTAGSESSVPNYYITDYDNKGFNFGTSDSSYNTNTWTYVVHAFKRATGFFDVVA